MPVSEKQSYFKCAYLFWIDPGHGNILLFTINNVPKHHLAVASTSC